MQQNAIVLFKFQFIQNIFEGLHIHWLGKNALAISAILLSLKYWLNIHNKKILNSYKPSVLFVGHRQTAPTQIRVSTVFLTEFSIRIWIEIKKIHPEALKFEKISFGLNMLNLISLNPYNHAESISYNELLNVFYIYLSREMWFPTMWHFDKCRLRQACAAPF